MEQLIQLKDPFLNRLYAATLGEMALALCGAAGAIVLSLALYRLLFHPLASVPGPFWAKFGYQYLTAQYFSGHWHTTCVELHKKYGPVVRIAANEVSIVDLQGMNSLFGIGKKAAIKTPWYYIWNFFSPGHYRGVFSDHDPRTHAISRKRTAGSFAMAYILSMEDTMADSWEQIQVIFDEAADKQDGVDLSHWSTLFAYETISSMGGFPLSFLKDRRDTYGVIDRIKDSFWLGANIGHYPALMPVLTVLMNVSKRLQGVPTREEGGKLFAKYCYETVAKRRAAWTGPPERMDLIDYSLAQKQADGQPFDLTALMSDAGNLLGAGADTTSIGIRAVLGRIVDDAAVRARIQTEIDVYCRVNGIPKDQHLSYRDCADLGFFQATVREAMRLHPSIVWQLPRIVPEGGVVVAGHYLAEGTYASINPYSSNRNGAVYAEPEKFDPERWLADDKELVKHMDTSLATFGHGSRVCMGRHLAHIEICLFVVNLLHRYDVYQDESKPSPWVRSYWLAPTEDLHITLTRRK